MVSADTFVTKFSGFARRYQRNIYISQYGQILAFLLIQFLLTPKIQDNKKLMILNQIITSNIYFARLTLMSHNVMNVSDRLDGHLTIKQDFKVYL